MSEVTYSSYLMVDQLLGCQRPQSRLHGEEVHEEHLFIAVHQVQELWMAQIHVDLDAVVRELTTSALSERAMLRLVSRIQRVVKIFGQMEAAFSVLETMAPLDFLDFRQLLGSSSGFQSQQFRALEIKLGVFRGEGAADRLKMYLSHYSPDQAEVLRTMAAGMNLADGIGLWLHRTPFLGESLKSFWQTYIDAAMGTLDEERARVLSGEMGQQALKSIDSRSEAFLSLLDKSRFQKESDDNGWFFSQEALQAALLIHLFQEEPALQLPFRLLNTLVDLDQAIISWKQHHVNMVKRMIGSRMGTGGTAGQAYLRKRSELRLFGELTAVPNFLLPRTIRPALPEGLKRQMNFNYTDRSRIALED